MGWRSNDVPADYPALHRALLTGLLGNIASRALTPGPSPEGRGEKVPLPSGEGVRVRGEYLGARGIKLYIFPGSGQFKAKPNWLMAAELVETSRLYGRCVARIEPEWIEQAAGALCRRSYSEPHWEKRGGQVAAFEQVTVYGLTVVVKRKVNYGPIDPVLSRQIFIRSALVEGDYESDAEFFKHNRKLIEQVEELEHKARRLDILVDEQTLYEFYETRVPEGIYSGAQFETWRKQVEPKEPKLLFLTREEIMRQRGEGITRQAFPDFFQIQGARLKLEYHFEPGVDADGVTLNLPVQMLNQLSPARCEWLVPGLLHEKIVALMRGLPKQVRKQFVPLPDFAQAALEALEPGDLPLGEALGHYLHRISGVAVPPDAWDAAKLPAHLRMNFRLQDERGQVLAMGRDLAVLQAQWHDQAQERFARLPKHGLEREHLTDWDFGELPEEVKVKLKGLSLPGYPALVDTGQDTALHVFSDKSEALRAHRAGLRRLFALQAAPTLKQLRRQAGLSRELILYYAALGKPEDLKDDLAEALVDEIFLASPWPHNRAEFTQRLEQGRAMLFPQAAERLAVLEGVMRDYHALKRDFPVLADFDPSQVRELKDLARLQTSNMAYREAVEDIRAHLGQLVYPGFARHAPFAQLKHFPRYLKAIRLRLERLKQAPGKDAQRAAEFAPLWQAYCRRREAVSAPDQALENFRWLLEELRVSLFAQELKTAVPVSVARAEKAWKDVIG
jgi:ATP-dependent helicase HrpA